MSSPGVSPLPARPSADWKPGAAVRSPAVPRRAPTPAALPAMSVERSAHRQWMWIASALMGLMPLIPTTEDPVSLAFAAAFGMVVISAIKLKTYRTAWPHSASFLFLFLGCCILSMFTARLGGTGFGTWIRGLIPFLFLASYLCFFGVNTLQDAYDAIDCIQFAACVWAARIFVIAGPAVLQVMTGQLGRLTWVCLDTLIPFGMIGYLVTLTNPSPRFARYRWILLPMFAMFVVICAYRSHIALCALATVIVLWRAHPAILMRAVAGGAALGAVACWFAGDVIFAVWDNVWGRFQGSDSDGLGTRAWEIQYAWEQFRASPVWGQGLGHQIPINVVHDLSASENVDLEEDSVGYMHNVWMYMLMDLGLTGMLSYLFMFASPIVAAWRSVRRRDPYHDLQFCALLTLSFMLIYTSCQAAFRLIQFNVVLGLLLTALSLPRPAEGARR